MTLFNVILFLLVAVVVYYVLYKKLLSIGGKNTWVIVPAEDGKVKLAPSENQQGPPKAPIFKPPPPSKAPTLTGDNPNPKYMMGPPEDDPKYMMAPGAVAHYSDHVEYPSEVPGDNIPKVPRLVFTPKKKIESPPSPAGSDYSSISGGIQIPIKKGKREWFITMHGPSFTVNEIKARILKDSPFWVDDNVVLFRKKKAMSGSFDKSKFKDIKHIKIVDMSGKSRWKVSLYNYADGELIMQFPVEGPKVRLSTIETMINERNSEYNFIDKKYLLYDMKGNKVDHVIDLELVDKFTVINIEPERLLNAPHLADKKVEEIPWPPLLYPDNVPPPPPPVELTKPIVRLV